MKIYRISKYGIEIKELEMVRETEKQVVYLYKWSEDNIREEKSNKISDWYRFFKTYEDAKEFLLNRENEKVKYLEEEILKHKNNITILEGMKDENN